MSSIVLVRHGQASFGTDNYDQLSELGQRQSTATGVHLARSGMRPTHIYSGELVRQKHTAALALKSMGQTLPITALSAFNEYDSDGVFTAFLPAVLDEHPDIRDRITRDNYSLLRDRAVFRRLFFPVMLRWIEGREPGDHHHEPWAEFRARVTDGLSRVSQELADDDCAVIFTSGGVISASMVYALGMACERGPEFNWRTANASITRFISTDRGLELEAYNNYAHLQSGDSELRVTYL